LRTLLNGLEECPGAFAKDFRVKHGSEIARLEAIQNSLDEVASICSDVAYMQEEVDEVLNGALDLAYLLVAQLRQG
jgi:hypothetical protein